MIELKINSEFGKLTHVVLATVENYAITEPVNRIQEKYYSSDPPQLAHLLSEQKQFVKVLEDNHVQIYWATPLPQCPMQVNTRDIAAVIGNIFVLGNMKWSMRKDEILGLKRVIEKTKSKLLQMPESGILEGGDIVINYPIIYLGLGERTDISGFNFIKDKFGDECEVIPLKLKEGFLHLDVVFNIISNDTAICFPPAFVDESISFFQERFANLIVVTEEEQLTLATNIFALNSKKVIIDERNIRITDILRNLGFEVIELEYSHSSRIGGSFRCATLPLARNE
jgi:N-dimethylarginine dimethylaminohydrolase